MATPDTIRILITAIVLATVLTLRLRGARRERPLKLWHLAVVPVLYAGAAGALFLRAMPHGLGWLAVVVALALGGAAGWWRGTTMTIRVDPETRALNQRASPAAILVLIGLVAVRLIGLQLIGEHNAYVSLALMTDVLVAAAFGMLTMTRVEMFLRARRLLTAHPAAAPA